MDQENKQVVPTDVLSPSADEGKNIPASVPQESATSQAQSSTVVLSNPNARISIWFYLVFGIVVAVFLVMTTILVKTLLPGQSSLPPVNTASPTVTKAAVSVLPSFTPVLTKTVDPIVSQYNQLNTGDEIIDLETDIKATDLSSLDQSIASLDAQMKFTSPKN